jgi:hypothetical protein
MTGGEAVQVLRAGGCRAVIVICSAHCNSNPAAACGSSAPGGAGGGDACKRFRAAGADLCWTKPFPPAAQMFADLARLCAERNQRGSASGGVSSGGSGGGGAGRGRSRGSERELARQIELLRKRIEKAALSLSQCGDRGDCDCSEVGDFGESFVGGGGGMVDDGEEGGSPPLSDYCSSGASEQ